MSYRFPDVLQAFMEVLEPFGEVTAWLPIDFQQRVTPTHPVVHVEDGEGDERGMFRTDEIKVSVYGWGRSNANEVAEAIRAHLTGSVAWETKQGLLDTIEVRRVPFSAQYAHDRISKVSAVYVVDSRPVFD